MLSHGWGGVLHDQVVLHELVCFMNFAVLSDTEAHSENVPVVLHLMA